MPYRYRSFYFDDPIRTGRALDVFEPSGTAREAENEHMFPLELNRAIADRVREAGARAKWKVYTRAEHGFLYDVTRRQQKEALADILKFVESVEQPFDAPGDTNREAPPL